MPPKQFVKTYLPYAIDAENATGINRLAILAQAAWESAWGKSAPGNMFFGVKDTDGLNGNEQLLTTHEYSTRKDLKFPVIYSITPVYRAGRPMFKYKIGDYFRKFESPADCFKHHCKFFLQNHRYSKALKVKQDPVAFLEAVAAAGYATDPNYANNMKKIVRMIEKLL